MWSDTEYAIASEPADLTRAIGATLVVSTHLGEAVSSCASLLGGNPGTRVVTVFAGLPGNPAAGSQHSHGEGQHGLADAMEVRQEEDLLALFLLDAAPVWLDFIDPKCGPRPRLARLAGALGEQVGRHSPDSVVFPLGLGTDDHRLVADACLDLCASTPDRRWIAYADASGPTQPRSVQARGQDLLARGFALDPLHAPRVSARKRHAVECYASRSQAPDPSRHVPIEGVSGREHYWQIRRNG